MDFNLLTLFEFFETLLYYDNTMTREFFFLDEVDVTKFRKLAYRLMINYLILKYSKEVSLT